MKKCSKFCHAKRNIETITILTFSALIMFCVIWVMLFSYVPNMNAIGALASVCIDITSICIILTFIVGYLFEKGERNNTTRLFFLLLLGSMWALFLDFLNWAYDGSLTFDNITHLFTLGSLCMGSILAILFNLYLGSYLYHMYKLKTVRMTAIVCGIINFISFLVTFVLAITRQAFTFVDGHYETGALYDVVTIIPILTLFYMTGYTIRYIKIIGIHDTWAVVGYIFTMICGAMIESVYRIGATYASITIANIFIFVMLQNKIINEERKRVENLLVKTNTDDFTGFYNRRAYEDEITALEISEINENFVYVSIDVNSLKIANDMLGHDAGDELILGACECMKQVFGPFGKLYRIGGDEFVALIYVDSSELDALKKDIIKATSSWEGTLNEHLTISCGYVTLKEAASMSLHQIAVLADKRMYENKTKYYQKKGVDRRGQKDAHVALYGLYTKILKINLTDDSYQIINMYPDEKTKVAGFASALSNWFEGFANSDLLYSEDKELFLGKTNIDYLKSYFNLGKDCLRVFYRRRIDCEYKSVMMEIIPSRDYSEDNQSLFLYVKDIEN